MFRTTPPASMISLHAWVSRARARPPGAVFAASNAALMLAELEAAPGAAVREMQRVARRAPGSADMRAALAALYWAQARRRPPPKPVPSSACARRCRRQAQSEGAGACRDLSASRAPASAHSRGRAGVCVERAACACAECRRCVFDTVQAKSLQVCAGHSQRLCMQLCSEWHSHQHTRPRQGNEAAAEGEWSSWRCAPAASRAAPPGGGERGRTAGDHADSAGVMGGSAGAWEAGRWGCWRGAGRADTCALMN